jgi:hypothetical protein
MSDDFAKIETLLTNLVEHRKSERGTVIERHAQTIMVGLVTIGIVFVSNSITSQNADIKVLQSQVVDLKEFVRATANKFVTTAEFEIHKAELERRVNKLESYYGINGD